MVFSGEIFLYLFFPVVFILYYILPVKFRNILLLFASLFFYAWGEPIYIFLMLISILTNFLVARNIQKAPKYGKIFLIFGISFNLLLLIIFKYTNFIIDNISMLSGFQISTYNIALPVGISFFTFQAMSFIIDIYKKPATYKIKLVNTALYISFFPQLIAGPIVKYYDIEGQIRKRKCDISKIQSGLMRFILGLSKKLLIANTMGMAADKVFSLATSELNAYVAWAGAISYTLQIYFDFSGYSDMAIGLGRIFGFDLKENFNYPFISKSIREFWKRWHISLSTWFKEYVYIPLGGNRKGKYRTYLNLWIVFLLTGFWHGAMWTFVLWGIIHGIFMVIERSNVFSKKKTSNNFFNHIYVLFVLCVSFTIFRSPNISYSFEYIKAMFTNFNITSHGINILSQTFTPYFIFILSIAIIASMPVIKHIKKYEDQKFYKVLEYSFSFILLIFSLFSLAFHSYNPFIYFRF